MKVCEKARCASSSASRWRGRLLKRAEELGPEDFVCLPGQYVEESIVYTIAIAAGAQ